MNKNLVCWLMLLTVALFIGGCSGDQEVTVTGLIDAVEIDVASKIPGRIIEVFVREGDAVEQGQQLATITGEEIAAKMGQVNAAIDAAKAQYNKANKGAREEQKRAAARQLDAARHQVEVMEKMYNRMVKLLEKDAVPKAKFDEVEFKYNVSKEQMEMARAQYDAVMKGAREEDIAAAAALVKRAEATLDEVKAYDKETVQVAPIAGEVSKVILHPGELAATGYPIITLVDMSELWATFSVREDLLRKIQKGATVSLYVPALDRTVPMEIYHLAAQGDFATWRATSERGGFDLKSFEVRARPTQPVEGLRPGMTVRWTIK
ncbi:MAG TPA: efflux RND transporter periplasmic adaptor subunit [bacterium]|nr:efflux RND transporter periplasmic adaptor subunit [bacterium]